MGAECWARCTQLRGAQLLAISLWGAHRIARRLDELQVTTAEALDGEPDEPFRGASSTVGPTVASAITALAFALTALTQDGVAAAIIRGATWFLLGIALFSLSWTHAAVLLGITRLGRTHLDPAGHHVDPGLGSPLGAVASTGLWMLLVWLVPVLLTGLPDIVGAVIGLLVLAAALATFFLSMVGLHRQMLAVKKSELAVARELYACAYAPVHATPHSMSLKSGEVFWRRRPRGRLDLAVAQHGTAHARLIPTAPSAVTGTGV